METWTVYWPQREKLWALEDAQLRELGARLPDLMGHTSFRNMVARELGQPGRPPIVAVTKWLNEHTTPSSPSTAPHTLTKQPTALLAHVLSFLDQSSVINASHSALVIFMASRQPGARSHLEVGVRRKGRLDELLLAEGQTRGDHFARVVRLDETSPIWGPYLKQGGLLHLVARLRHLEHVALHSHALVEVLPPLPNLKVLHVDRRLVEQPPLSATLLRDVVVRPDKLRELGGCVRMSGEDVQLWREMVGLRRLRLEIVFDLYDGIGDALRGAWPQLERLELGAQFDRYVENPQRTADLVHALLNSAETPPAFVLAGSSPPDPHIGRLMPNRPRVSALHGALRPNGRLFDWMQLVRADEVVVPSAFLENFGLDTVAALGAASQAHRMEVVVRNFETQEQLPAGAIRVRDVPPGRILPDLIVHVRNYWEDIDHLALVRSAGHVDSLEVHFWPNQWEVPEAAEALRRAATHNVHIVEDIVEVLGVPQRGLTVVARMKHLL